MDWSKFFVFYEFFLIIHLGWLTEFPPPKHIRINSSVLTWNPSIDDRNVTYTVQYSTVPVGQWTTMTSCRQLQCDFTDKDFYGKVFRVQANSGNLSSVWQQSEQVQCAHINTCAPIINLTVARDEVHLWMEHRDRSLKKEFGSHITFRPLYWKSTSPDDKQMPDDMTNPLILLGLESGKNYCFQVEYLCYQKSCGNSSNIICQEIPETSVYRTIRIIFSGALSVMALAIFGFCFYFANRNCRKIKQLLQPPLDIPVHYQEFFLNEFSEHQVDYLSNQDTEVCDTITFASEPEVI